MSKADKRYWSTLVLGTSAAAILVLAGFGGSTYLGAAAALLAAAGLLLWSIRERARRVQAEEALRRSEERHRAVVENVNEAIVVIQNGRPKFFNSKAAEWFGFSRAEDQTLDFEASLHPEDRERIQDLHTRRMAGEEAETSYDFRIVDKPGQTKWLHANVVAIDWAGQPAALTFLTDITERMESEELLRLSEVRYRGLIETSPDAVYLSHEGHEGEIFFVNPAMCKLMGAGGPEELVGRSILELIEPGYRDQARDRLRGQVRLRVIESVWPRVGDS